VSQEEYLKIIAAKDTRIQELERKVEELLEKLNKNSHNSHLPPSSDGPGRRPPPPKKKSKSKRKRGGQKGHKGHKRDLLPPEQVDYFVDHYPHECENCWLQLPEIPGKDATRIQVTEVPPICPKTTEHRYHSITCHCGYTTRAKFDDAPKSSFGPRLMSLIALFTGVYHLSRRQTASILLDVLGVQISVGSISTIESRVSEAIAPAVDEVSLEVEAAAVKHTDATSWLQNGKLRSLWTLATNAATLFKIFTNGAAETIKPLFGACTGILISDRATVFSFWVMKKRQICWAHLIRKFISFSERDGPAKKFGEELLDYAALVFDYWHQYQDGKINKTTFQKWMEPVQSNFEASLERAVDAKIEKLSGSCANILAHKQALWTFITHAGVEPTNNHAERELRAFVLWRKRSFGSRSERGMVYAANIMTVAHTARKQNKNILSFLVQCCQAWMTNASSPSLFESKQLIA
jgi:transposase